MGKMIDFTEYLKNNGPYKGVIELGDNMGDGETSNLLNFKDFLKMEGINASSREEYLEQMDPNSMLFQDLYRDGLISLDGIIEEAIKRKYCTEEYVSKYMQYFEQDGILLKAALLGKYEDALMRMREIINIQKEKVVMATMVDEDGNETQLTAGLFAAMVNEAMSEHPEVEAKEKLKFIVADMIKFAESDEDIVNDLVGKESIEFLRLLYEKLDQGEIETNLEQFLRGKREYLPTPRPAGIEDLLSVCISGKKAGHYTMIVGNSVISLTHNLGYTEQVINEIMRIAFLQNNPHKSKGNLNTVIELSISDTMAKLKRKYSERNAKAFRSQLINEILPAIKSVKVEVKSKNGDVFKYTIGTGEMGISPRKDKFYFKITDTYALYLNRGPVSQSSSKILEAGDARNTRPFYVGLKLQNHYFNQENQKRGTNNILSINALLNFCQDIILSYEDVQKNDRGHWTGKIRRPLEEALNELAKVGAIKWKYCKSKKRKATPQEINTSKFEEWRKLYITFEFLDPPDINEIIDSDNIIDVTTSKPDRPENNMPELKS